MIELSTLVTAAQHGDKAAFGQIVLRFQDMAFASAYALVGDTGTAQDAAQEAFIDAYLTLPKLREPAAFPGWFRRIIFKHSDRQVRGKPVQLLPLEVAEDLRSPLPTPEEWLIRAELRQEVDNAIRLLPPDQRQVIALFYVEGYAQQEIAAFLELPVSTVKKRLFDARKRLKERMISMVQATLQITKPSQNASFSQTVAFFTALLVGDVSAVEQLIQQDPALVAVKTEWEMQLRGLDWSLGATALHLAAAHGDRAMAQMLVTRQADVSAPDSFGMMPIHVAVIMRQPAMAEQLIRAGAQVNGRSAVGQTGLHLAAQRQDVEFARLLLAHQADPTIFDNEGRTAADWAAIKGNVQLTELLTPAGATRLAVEPHPLAKSIPAGAMLETGIKAIDLLAPLPRGGRIGIYTARPGIGLLTVLGQLIASLHELHSIYTVSIGLETESKEGESLSWSWRKVGVYEQLFTIYGQVTASLAQRRQIAEQGLTKAATLRQEGKSVLLLVDGQLALTEGILDYLSAHTSAAPEASLTVLVHGNFTAGAEPAPLADLDAVITLDAELAEQHLYPAVDRQWSRSNLLTSNTASAEHRQVAAEVRRLLRRYAELHDAYEKSGENGFWYISDDVSILNDIKRARRLQRFLTQPFTGAEPWTGLVGQHTPVADTIQGCQAILDGTHDSLPEEAFGWIGSIEQAVVKGG